MLDLVTLRLWVTDTVHKPFFELEMFAGMVVEAFGNKHSRFR